MEEKKKRVVGIVGPTASGKTALSLAVASKLGAEIVCMDSMQIYRGMDIGTAKPTARERALVPHHMLDVARPGDSFTVSQYAKAAEKCLRQISVPLLVGGTGLYLQSLSQPMDFGTVGGSEEIRAKYHQLADVQGNDALHARLAAIDPLSAARLHKNDVRRVIRALEVYEISGVPLSAQPKPDESQCPFDFQLYALDLPRDVLYARIDRRVDEMMAQGLLNEVRSLMEGGLSPDAQSMQGLGYKELMPVLRGETTLSDAVSLIKLRTRHFAKRQLTWFQRDARITWLPFSPDGIKDLADLICRNYTTERN